MKIFKMYFKAFLDDKSVILKSIAFIFTYLVAAKIGLMFAMPNVSVAIIWPSGGIALAVLLLGGTRYLPAVFLAAYFAAVMVDAPLIFALGSTIGNGLETYLGYLLLKRYGKLKLPKINTPFDFFEVVTLGALIPPVVSALLGCLSLLASGLIHLDSFYRVMWHWWQADVLGIAFFTPLILVFAERRSIFHDLSKIWELLALWLTAIVVGQVVFLAWTPITLFGERPNLVWIFPIVVWAGLRTGRRNTALIQLLFMGQALASAYMNVGVFADEFERYGLTNFWMFSLLLALCGMTLVILSTAQRHSAKVIAQNAWVFEVSHDGVLITDADNNMVSVNAAFTQITGYSEDDVLGKNPRILASGRHDKAFYEQMWNTINATRYWTGEIWNRRKDGSVYLEQISIHAIGDSKGIINSYLAIFSDITQQKAKQDAMTYQAHHDFLTRLPNRMLFCDRFSQQLAFAKRHHIKFALLYLDLDQFKPVNDQFGHSIGDELLIAVAARLSGLVREIDTVSRFGGDEFSILVSEVETIEDVIQLADKVLGTLNESFVLSQHTVNVSASIGVAMYPDHGSDMQTMMHRADLAMYEAKRSGHNKYVIADIAQSNAI